MQAARSLELRGGVLGYAPQTTPAQTAPAQVKPASQTHVRRFKAARGGRELLGLQRSSHAEVLGQDLEKARKLRLVSIER